MVAGGVAVVEECLVNWESVVLDKEVKDDA